jgi:hypothetical protein
VLGEVRDANHRRRGRSECWIFFGTLKFSHDCAGSDRTARPL